jgi:hypothetical protein
MDKIPCPFCGGKFSHCEDCWMMNLYGNVHPGDRTIAQTPPSDRTISIDGASLESREAQAIDWFFSQEARDFSSCEVQDIIRQRFGDDVDESLRQKYSKYV